MLADVDTVMQIVDKTIMEADKDRDGKISFEEFTKMVENTDVSMSMTLGKSWFWNMKQAGALPLHIMPLLYFQGTNITLSVRKAGGRPLHPQSCLVFDLNGRAACPDAQLVTSSLAFGHTFPRLKGRFSPALH